MRSWVAVLLMAAVASADPKPDPGLVTKGRALAASGKHREAIALYERYLATAPDDVAANAELGWSALQLKDYPRAEQATLRAIASSQPPAFRGDPTGNPRAAAFYNLALILDAQSKRKEAGRRSSIR